MLEIIQLAVLKDNYSYLIHDSIEKVTAAIDPALAQPLLAVLARNGWQLNYILNTHHHSDHVGGNLELKEKTGCTIIGSAVDKLRIPAIDRAVVDGELITLGQQTAQVIETKGHTNGHVVYYFAQANALFCGDTLFVMGCGRLFEGTAAQLFQSLETLKTLPSETQVYCAHEYSQMNGRFALSVEPCNQVLQQRMIEIDKRRAADLPTVPSTLAQECATNPFLRTDSLAIQQTIHQVDSSPLAVFTELRRRRNAF